MRGPRPREAAGVLSDAFFSGVVVLVGEGEGVDLTSGVFSIFSGVVAAVVDVAATLAFFTLEALVAGVFFSDLFFGCE